MARSPSDATRFTATGPYASSSTSFNTTAPPSVPPPPKAGTTINFGSAPPNETPQQKIARLRAASQAAKRGTETAFDTTVRVGRIWADRVHRVTATSLIGLTVVSACVAAAGITDMLLHNRRRRNEWLAEKQAESARDLAMAIEAQKAGRASEDQTLLINRERAAMEAAEAKRNQPGILKRTTGWLFSGAEKEEQKGGRLGAGAGALSANSGQRHDRSVLQAVQETVDSHRRQAERIEEVARPLGGPLDQQAQLTIDSLSSSKTWMSWTSRR
ncbi:hypothetical protein BAUCODRAFT_114540 [Baudoinia panamericana UAMH 10762]|uniref:Uncharacterized protein n=1 Tax=Baudoinia panamericana (strain UAMH 10762) TaxID=717646 RepID=M2MMQ6_BAUPA|nr:uncharacterized protein BAUCODRAFT_114540 [Baudoinia panamericana UAMH 10762]EMC92703.1 hypothetical protein BAUCODRAFT_114540 [Baudoinia panamericana UAMH 10762]